MEELLAAGFFLRARQVNNTRFLQPDITRTWSDDALYAWVYEGSQWFTIVGALGLLVVAFALVMFPLWPASVRSLSRYAIYLAVGFVGFLVVTSIIRLIVFGITYFTTKPGIWIFPNLWEDCGFFESFVPLWDWHKVAVVAKQPTADASATATNAEHED